MALTEHSIPLLEYDDDPAGILVPNREEGYAFPRRAVLFFGWEPVERLVEEQAARGCCREIGRFETITKTARVYALDWGGQELALCAAPLGSAGAVEMLDFFIGCGCTAIVAGGSCGALDHLPEGAFLLPTHALRDEGASYHYLPPARWAETDASVRAALRRACEEKGFAAADCRTWTTDGFFRETAAKAARRRAEGCAVVEMECAGLAACAAFRGVRFGQLLYTADTLAAALAGGAHDARTWGNEAAPLALALCLDAAAWL